MAVFEGRWCLDGVDGWIARWRRRQEYTTVSMSGQNVTFKVPAGGVAYAGGTWNSTSVPSNTVTTMTIPYPIWDKRVEPLGHTLSAVGWLMEPYR